MFAARLLRKSNSKIKIVIIDQVYFFNNRTRSLTPISYQQLLPNLFNCSTQKNTTYKFEEKKYFTRQLQATLIITTIVKITLSHRLFLGKQQSSLKPLQLITLSKLKVFQRKKLN